jgi:hypothetical protein
MRAERTNGSILPPVISQWPDFRVDRVNDPVLRLGRLTDHEQPHGFTAVVQEAVSDAGACRKADAVAGGQTEELAVDPNVGRSLDHIDELLLRTFRMGKRGPSAGRQEFMVDAESCETRAVEKAEPMLRRSLLPRRSAVSSFWISS